jgi:hypothetical protein
MAGKNPWTKNQIKTFAKEVRKDWGGLWPHVQDDVRSALALAKAAKVLNGQMPEYSITSQDFTAFCRDLVAELELL